MVNYKGTALVTGASSGIGEAFARELARRGMNLVLVARSEGKLQELAVELRRVHGAQVHVICADLARQGGPEAVFRATEERDLKVTMLVNNAGFATYGEFQELDLVREQEQVMLNVHAVVTLTSLYLPKLLLASGAAIVNVASTAAFQPLPYMAVYGATKAFVLSFSEALWGQLKNKDVSVLAFCPGPVKTQFEHVVGAQEAMVGKQDTPEFVVQMALKALDARRSFVVPRFSQFLLSSVGRLMPRAAVVLTTAKVLRPRGVPLLQAERAR